MSMTSENVTAVLGPVDRMLIAEIIATGATPAELAEAWAWINSEEALVSAGRTRPSGRVAQLVDLLAPDDDDDPDFNPAGEI